MVECTSSGLEAERYHDLTDLLLAADCGPL